MPWAAVLVCVCHIGTALYFLNIQTNEINFLYMNQIKLELSFPDKGNPEFDFYTYKQFLMEDARKHITEKLDEYKRDENGDFVGLIGVTKSVMPSWYDVDTDEFVDFIMDDTVRSWIEEVGYVCAVVEDVDGLFATFRVTKKKNSAGEYKEQINKLDFRIDELNVFIKKNFTTYFEICDSVKEQVKIFRAEKALKHKCYYQCVLYDDKICLINCKTRKPSLTVDFDLAIEYLENGHEVYAQLKSVKLDDTFDDLMEFVFEFNIMF